MKFPDASGVPVNMLPISDGSAFDQLKQLVDKESDDLAGPDWLGMLAAIGIVKGQPFTPDAQRKRNSRSGGEDCLQDEPRDRFRTSGRRPLLHGLSRPSLGQSNGRRDPGETIRSINLFLVKYCWKLPSTWIPGSYFFTNYYSISPGMLSYTPGKGANYMIGFTDSEGAPLSGGSNYRVHLPPNIPAGIFWSVTLYDAENSRVSLTAVLSHRWVHATSQRKMLTAARTFTSVLNRLRAKKPTGSRLRLAKDISRSSGSTALQRPQSIGVGSRVI